MVYCSDPRCLLFKSQILGSKMNLKQDDKRQIVSLINDRYINLLNESVAGTCSFLSFSLWKLLKHSATKWSNLKVYD